MANNHTDKLAKFWHEIVMTYETALVKTSPSLES